LVVAVTTGQHVVAGVATTTHHGAGDPTAPNGVPRILGAGVRRASFGLAKK
jgi:hypothetical protein